MKKGIFLISCVALLPVIPASAEPQAGGSIKQAIAVINPASSSSCRGTVRFTEEGNGVKVAVDIEGLAPNSKHGFHVHEYGDCSAPDATSAGSHYDAAGTKHHGMPSDAMRHAGDMGNIEADATGKVHSELMLGGVTVNGAQAPILGRAVIVHANPDDFSQPVGNAGGRIGCGVIGVVKPTAPLMDAPLKIKD
jgi:Cu-Zn family superoxide dismutase